MVDSAKYRESLTEWIWHGRRDESKDAEASVTAAKAAVGKRAPDTALEQAKALRERLLQNKERSSD